MVTITGDEVFFAKNSDRDPNEAQLLEWVPAAEHRLGALARCTWILVPQVRRTRAVLLSRPWWMWGAEMGANDRGVVIGNEAVFTRRHDGGPGLLGMDLLRLALERADDADSAVQVIVSLLERHGQGGPASRDHPGFSYDNSFLVADRNGAVVLETAGRRWATEHVAHGARSISNELTIPGFARAHSDRLRSRVAEARRRRPLTTAAARSATSELDLFAALRSHGAAPDPSYSPLNGAMGAPCMHAGGLVANSQTTASWVSRLGASTQHWATGTAAPCTAIFKPVSVDAPTDLGASPTDRADDQSRWWRHESLHRIAARDLGSLTARFSHERDALERAWVEQSLAGQAPSAAEAFEVADELEARWTADLAAADAPDRRPPITRAYWHRQDRAAGFSPRHAATAVLR